MSYTKNTWVDQVGQVKYSETTDGDYIILTPNYDDVNPIGTPVNATNMNHIEDGIEGAYTYVDTQISTMLNALYPVGSIYIGTQENCPLETLGIGTWALVAADKTLQGSSENHVANTTINAGLPNIKGSFDRISSGTMGVAMHSSGAFSLESSTKVGAEPNTTNSTFYKKVNFDASRSNSIYSDSVTTVQPPAYVVNIWRRTA